MNTIYKVVFNRSTQTWAVVSELARGVVKATKTAVVVSAVSVMSVAEANDIQTQLFMTAISAAQKTANEAKTIAENAEKVVSTKADQSELASLATKAEVADKADKSALEATNKEIESLDKNLTVLTGLVDNALETLSDKANSKADQAALDATNKSVSELAETKADQTALNATNKTVEALQASKADQSEVDALSKTVAANKAQADKQIAQLA